MNKIFVVCFGFALLALYTGEAVAQQQDSDAESLQSELDTLRDGLFHAFNEGKYEEMLNEFCHEDVITMWQDGTSSKGHAGVLAEFEKLSHFIDKMEVQPTVEERLILNDGKLVVSSGKMNDKYALSRGVDVELNSHWTATMVNEDGRWMLASFSASSNAFDNEVVSLYLRYTKYWSAGIGLLCGVAIGIIGTLFLSRKRGLQTSAA